VCVSYLLTDLSCVAADQTQPQFLDGSEGDLTLLAAHSV